MDFLKKSHDISVDDYKIVKQIIEWNDMAYDLHSCRRPSGLHIKMFLGLYKRMIIRSYEIEKSAFMIKSSNPDIGVLQRKLVDNLNWSIFYNTPVYIVIVVNLSLLTFFASALATIKIYHITRQEAFLWYNRVLKMESREYLTHSWQELQL